ncbi:hypothetical protein CRV24_010031 [Beauveria bassiana]|nr:hypothetical protein CRV24_010031 [Beauveria bassiana]KAH8708329.1 hypothetical protein HC256_010469 [Beauveria bassiana]
MELRTSSRAGQGRGGRLATRADEDVAGGINLLAAHALVVVVPANIRDKVGAVRGLAELEPLAGAGRREGEALPALLLDILGHQTMRSEAIEMMRLKKPSVTLTHGCTSSLARQSKGSPKRPQPVDEQPHVLLDEPLLLPQRRLGKAPRQQFADARVARRIGRQDVVRAVGRPWVPDGVAPELAAGALLAVDVAPALRVDEGELVGRPADHGAELLVELAQPVQHLASAQRPRVGQRGDEPQLWTGEARKRVEVEDVDAPANVVAGPDAQHKEQTGEQRRLGDCVRKKMHVWTLL